MKPFNVHKVFFAIVIILFLGCKKEKIFNNDDKFVEQTEELSVLQAEVSSAGQDFLELSWKQVSSTHFKAVSYSIHIDDVKVVEGITNTKYALVNLKAGQGYKIKIIASTTDGKAVEQLLSAKTLDVVTRNVFYREYSIHSFSTLTGSTNVRKASDGSHIVARFLSHPANFGGEYMKIIVFRLDKDGNMAWYRLLSTAEYRGTTLETLPLTLHNNDKEIIVFAGSVATKLNAVSGEVILSKNFQDGIGSQIFQSLFYTVSQQIIIGTNNGSLLSINPTNLTINWHQINESRRGVVVAINADSKNNIYYIFQDRADQHPQIRIHKCDANGFLISNFLFDGSLPNEGNWGFIMNALLVDAQDNLYLFGHNSDFAYLRYFKFNTEGAVIKKNTISDPLIAKYAFFTAKGDIAVAGRTDRATFNTYGTVYLFDKDLNIKSKIIYNDLPFHILQGITDNADGSYNLFLNYMQTYTYENFNFVFIKTGSDGKI